MFNDLFKATMKKEGVTGRKLAELLGVAPSVISYNLGKQTTDESTMMRFADALGYDLEISLVKRSGASTTTPEPAPTPAPVPQTPPPYYVDYTKEQIQQWKRYVGTESAPMPPSSPDFKLFKQFLDDVANHRMITFEEG